MKFNYGFTLIELIIVIALIGVVFGVGVTSYTATQKNSRDNRRRVDLELIRQALEVYRSENGFYPNEWTCDSSNGVDGSCDCHSPKVWPVICTQQPDGQNHNWGTPDPNWPGLSIPIYDELVPNYIKNLPIDPINSVNYYYSYEPNDCPNGGGKCSYELRARLEANLPDNRYTVYGPP